jgi:hypothetical protein
MSALSAQPDNSRARRASPVAGPVGGPAAGFISAAQFAGPDWLAKVNTAASTLLKGGTIEVPDSIADTATTVGAIPSNVTLEFTGSATFRFCQINVGEFSKIYNHDGLLQLAGPNCIGINQPQSATLQKSDKFILDGVRVDCDHQANSTGIFVGGAHAQTALRNVTVVNCSTAGLRLNGAQFGEYSDVSLYNNYVGLKIYSTPEGGGGNSNTFYGLKVVASTVGVLIVANSRFGMGADYFLNPSLLENSTAAMAVFGDTWPTDIHWYGGAPEGTGEKTSQGTVGTVTIDGHAVRPASIYANLARIILNEVSIAEARVTPFIRAENSSSIILNNVSGYGNSGGTLVSADASSTTTIEGRLDATGTIQNVVRYPSALGSNYVRMSGVAIASSTSEVPNAYAKNPATPAIVDTTGARSSATTNDRWLGPVTTVVHAPGRGNQENNRVNFGNVISSATKSESEILVSILLKSTADCSYVIGSYGDGYTTTEIHLVAGRWARALILKPRVRAGSGFTLIGFPNDASGPTVSFGRLEVLPQPSDTWESEGYAAVVLTSGAVNPNVGRQ